MCLPIWIGAKVLEALIAGGFALVHQQVNQRFLGSWLVCIQCSVNTVFHAVLFKQLYGATTEALNQALEITWAGCVCSELIEACIAFLTRLHRR